MVRSQLVPAVLLALVACGADSDGNLRAGEGPAESDPTGEAYLAPNTRTLDTPPDLEIGEWWKVEMVPELVGATYPTTLVVTHRDGNRARIGVPPDEFSHDFLVLHVPPLGDLELDTFAWRVMWDDFEALRFPLEPGRTWTADFHGRDVEAEVNRVEGHRAWVTMVGDGERIELTYDAEVGMITEFREEALGLGFRVVDHGFGHAGPVLDFSGIELALMESPARSTSPGGETHHAGEDRASASTVEVATKGSHGSLSLVLWNVGHEDEVGDYRITTTAPDGTRFEERFQGTAGSGSVGVRSFGHDRVQGSWQVEFEREGPAGLLVELFTYDLTEVELGGR